MEKITAYTDGSAVVAGKNKGRGGFGAYFPSLLGSPKIYSMGFWETKTGRMEIMALLYALKAIPLNKIVELTVYSDSQYVVFSFTKDRLRKWILNNWISYGEPIKNVDLWKKVLDELIKRPNLKLNMVHIKGHQYDKEKCKVKKKELLKNPHILGNTIADRFANYKRFKESDLKIDINGKTN